MGLYRLKAGSFLTGSGKERKKYNHADPNNNVVESDVNLAARHPEKFERVEQYAEGEGPYEYNPAANRRSADPAAVQAKTGGMPALTPTTQHRVEPKGKTLDEQYGNLDDLDDADLKQVAQAEEIAIPKHVTKKEDVVKHLRAAKGAALAAPAHAEQPAKAAAPKDAKHGK